MPALNNQFAIPKGAWDAHMHVTDLEQFPSPRKQVSTYLASNFTLRMALDHAATSSLPNLVFVQPSTYGTDNSCVLWCLKQRAANTARAVVVIDPRTIDKRTLLDWHELGVRGVRINLKAFGAKPSFDELNALVRSIDDALLDLPSWGIHFYVDLNVIPNLYSIIEALSSDRKICIDHMASPALSFIHDPMPWDLEVWTALRRLLERPNVFVKISAPYRTFQRSSSWTQLEGLVKWLLTIRDGDTVVFASDWPHTRFTDLDVAPWKALCLQWCGADDRLREKLFVKNSERLYDVNQYVE